MAPGTGKPAREVGNGTDRVAKGPARPIEDHISKIALKSMERSLKMTWLGVMNFFEYE